MIVPYHITTIAEYHRLMDLPKPSHPLISVIKFEDIKRNPGKCPASIMHYFYSIALKRDVIVKMRYGQEELDFDEGVMHFMAPKQVLSVELTNEERLKHSGWLLLIHPDFLWNTSLSKKIKLYQYFSYQVNEALHLSEKEESLVIEIIQKVEQEYHNNVDIFSQDVIVAQLELLLTYSGRYYQRQFITRKKAHHRVLNQLEDLLTDYFAKQLVLQGLPTVEFIAEKLNISANYLSRLLQSLTGQSTKQFIQDRVIELAKEKLSASNLSVNEIAYSLGFEHPQSFSKLFRIKTNLSPVEFRRSFK